MSQNNFSIRVIEIVTEEDVRKGDGTSNEEISSKKLSGPPKRAISMERKEGLLGFEPGLAFFNNLC
jgi:hypothetical protein